MTCFRDARAVRVHCPISEEAYAALGRGDATALADDSVAGPLLAILRGDGPLGDFGLYRGVAAIIPAIETFVPTAAAEPADGSAGQPNHVAMAVLHSWIDAAMPDDAIAALVGRIAAIHPWELPVIEIGAPVRLLVSRPPAS